MTLRPLLARSLDDALALIDAVAAAYAAGDGPMTASLTVKLQEWEVSVTTRDASTPLQRSLIVELKPAVLKTAATGTMTDSRLVLNHGPVGLYGHIEHLAWHMAVIANPALLAPVQNGRMLSDKSTMAAALVKHYDITQPQIAQSIWRGTDVFFGKSANIRFGNRFGQIVVQQFVAGTLIVSNENYYQIDSELPESAIQGLQRYLGQPISKIVDLEFMRKKSRIIHISGHKGLLRAVVKTNNLEADMILGTSKCRSAIAQKVRQHRDNLIKLYSLNPPKP